MSLTSLALARALHSSKTEGPSGPEAHPERNQYPRRAADHGIRKNEQQALALRIRRGDGPFQDHAGQGHAVCKVVLANRV